MEVIPKVPGGGLKARAEEREVRRAERFRFGRRGSGGQDEARRRREIYSINDIYIYLTIFTRTSVRTGHFMQPGLALTFATVLYLVWLAQPPPFHDEPAP